MSQRFLRVVGMSIAALPCFMAPASASDGKIHSGAECVAQLGTHQGDFIYTVNGGVSNVTGTTEWVTCPVVREYGASAEGALVDVDVAVYAPANVTVECHIYSGNASGSTWTDDDNYVIGGGYGTIDLDQPATTWTNGYFWLECGIGPGASLRNYLTLETGP